jgi:RNA polymerase sporulation-specific sigma factor
MALNKVEICGVNTARLPLLGEEEKEALFARIKEGDEEAREEYIKGNLRLVLSVIKRFSASNENADDLFQIGCVGLMKAVDNFDPDREVKFSTYAVPMIVGEIRRYLRDNNSIRVSRSLRDTAYKAIYAKENYIKKNMKEPTVQEIADEIGIAKEDIVLAMDAIQNPVSLYEPVYSEGGDMLYVMDQVSDKKKQGRKLGGGTVSGGGDGTAGRTGTAYYQAPFF